MVMNKREQAETIAARNKIDDLTRRNVRLLEELNHYKRLAEVLADKLGLKDEALDEVVRKVRSEE